ncbi:MAG TPA: zinc ribbon domain-containing protein [Terriglobia bacterium]|nr:zinc ribbon domain-containing protein [Terriglobia bacterium]
MPIMRTYQCPDCGGRFRFLHMTSDEPAPQECEICHSYMGDSPEPELSTPHFRPSESAGARMSQSVDLVQRDMEARGITDFKDGLREGDVAAKPVHNPVTEQIAQMEAAGASMWQSGGGGFRAADSNPNLDGRPALSAITRGLGGRK